MGEAANAHSADPVRLLSFPAAHVFRPPRREGAVPPAVAAGIALVLALALLLRGLSRGISFAAFGGDVLAVLLLGLAGLFGYWAYAIYNLRYLVDDDALVIVWGCVRQVIPAGAIERIVLGRRLGEPRLSGLTWRGCQVGRGYVERLGTVLFYSAHRSAAELVYVSTPGVTFGLSLTDARGLARNIQAAQEHLSAEPQPAVASYRVLPGQALLHDRLALALTAAAIVVFLLAAGYVSARYTSLPAQFTFAYPPATGAQRVGQRSELLRLPLSAFIWLVIGLALAAWSYPRLRGASYALLAGTLFAQFLYLVAALAAAH